MRNNSMNQIKNIISNPIYLSLILMQLILIVLFIAILTKNDTVDTGSDSASKKISNKVQIVNFDELIPDKDDDFAQITKRALFDSVTNRGVNVDSTLKATIRKNSIVKKQYSAFNVNYINFIVDIPEVKQSYQIKYDWSSNKNNQHVSTDDAFVISCIDDKDKVKYTSFSCSNPPQHTTKYDVIRQHVDYENFGDLEVYSSEDDIKELIIDITGSDETKDEATQRVEDWIKSMGYSPDGFVLSVYNG